MIIMSLFFGVIMLLLYVLIKIYSDKQWHKKPINNFPFIYKGKEFWYSRSVACVLFAFSKNENGEWCVLANKRGEGTPDNQGLWNVTCGYLDFHENGEECAQRENFEETGIFINLDKINLWTVNTKPDENRQNVVLRYYSILDNQPNNFSTENSEHGEVEDIKWIPLSEVDNYDWAFGHGELIKEFNGLSLLK